MLYGCGLGSVAIKGPGTNSRNDAAVREQECTSQGCACVPGAEAKCYSGPSVTRGVGLCQDGVTQCEGGGEFGTWGKCVGEKLPEGDEPCDGIDHDCDGKVCKPDAGQSRCGDGVCRTRDEESCTSCPKDCGECRECQPAMVRLTYQGSEPNPVRADSDAYVGVYLSNNCIESVVVNRWRFRYGVSQEYGAPGCENPLPDEPDGSTVRPGKFISKAFTFVPRLQFGPPAFVTVCITADTSKGEIEGNGFFAVVP